MTHYHRNGRKTTDFGILKVVTVNLDNKDVKFNLFVVDRSMYEILVGEPTMESFQGVLGVLDFGNGVVSFYVDGQLVEFAMEPD